MELKNTDTLKELKKVIFYDDKRESPSPLGVG